MKVKGHRFKQYALSEEFASYLNTLLAVDDSRIMKNTLVLIEQLSIDYTI